MKRSTWVTIATVTGLLGFGAPARAVELTFWTNLTTAAQANVIQKQIGELSTVYKRSLEELAAFRAELQKRGETRYELDENSADRLMVLLLPKVAPHIVSNHPTGRGVGGPTRISWFANRYVEIHASSSQVPS